MCRQRDMLAALSCAEGPGCLCDQALLSVQREVDLSAQKILEIGTNAGCRCVLQSLSSKSC